MLFLKHSYKNVVDNNKLDLLTIRPHLRIYPAGYYKCNKKYSVRR